MNLTRNLSLKMISLLIAVFLWLTVTSKEYRYGDFTIPLELNGLPKNLVVTSTSFDGQEVNNVTARVRASETLILSLGERSMFLSVDISGMGVGSHPVQLTEQMVMGRPPGAEITVIPRAVEIDIEQLMIRHDVVVNAEILGKPAENYDITSIRSDPSIVRVSGPGSIVEEIDMVRTQQINVDRLTEITLDRQVRLMPPNPAVNLFPETVNLRIRIEEKSISRKFEQVEIKIRGAEFQTRINPSRLDVWVQGPISQIKDLTVEDLAAYVLLDGDEARGENIRMDPQLDVSSGDSVSRVMLERFSQSYVDVLVTSKPLE
ncbi:MAG: YbbR-like domain-containing protein [Candidatus Glassbacteria bacterium]|nr:YbbR-like domain-containing protein [Candidatus Glassbacteria bacterium]